MFTGIVQELGEVVAVEPAGDSARLRVRAAMLRDGVEHGESIAVNGVCLTAADAQGADEFAADVMAETLRRSSLGALRPGDVVNLERAMALGDRLGGHLVQGHVDAVGVILAREPAERWEVVRISLPASLARYVVEKGSIAVDGVSLTVTQVSPLAASDQDGAFEVSLIPTTLERTTLGRKGVGEPVNLEVDMLAKHVERLLAARDGDQAAQRVPGGVR